MVAARERGRLALAGREQRVGSRGRKAREHREPEGAAHHERGVDDARCEACLARIDVPHGGEQHRVEGHPGAEPEQDHARQDIHREDSVHGRTCEEREPERRQRQARREREPDPEAHDELRRETEREHGHDQVRWHEREPDLERGIAEHELQVEGGEEEPGEHRGRPEDADDVRGGEVPQPEEPERYERGRNPGLDREEEHEQRARCGEQAERPSGRPPHAVAVHDRVDREHQRRGDRDRARDVEPPLLRLTSAGRKQEQREHEDGDPDRDVHEEDPVPAQGVREDAAEQDPDRPAACGDEAEDAHRLRALGRLREERHDE